VVKKKKPSLALKFSMLVNKEEAQKLNASQLIKWGDDYYKRP
jgi:hypothetical protein